MFAVQKSDLMMLYGLSCKLNFSYIHGFYLIWEKKDRAWVRSRMTEVILRSVCEELSPNREKWSICLIVKV